MQDCRIDYCLPPDGNFQDWLKRHIDKLQLTPQGEQALMNEHYALRLVYGLSNPLTRANIIYAAN